MPDQKDELVALAGAGNVLDDPQILESYSRDQSFVRAEKPRLVVKVANVDQVQKIIRWANETRTPLIPISSGPPHFHGDTVPGVAGAVVVDLSGMKKIIKIDRRNRMAMVEAGVTYTELQPELAKAGMRLSSPLLPRANKSILASLLEREPRLAARYQWSSMDPLRSLEVVFGDGNRMWTGGAGHEAMGDLEKLWSQQKWQLDPAGPGQADFYRFLSAAQGSIGIATWASLRCEVLPQIHRLFFVPAQNLKDLYDFTYKILRFRYADELFLLNAANLAYLIGGAAAKVSRLKSELPAWTVVVGIAGRDELPEERVDFQEKDIAEIAREFGLDLEPQIAGVKGEEVLNLLINSSRMPFWKMDYKGAFQDIFFVTTLDKTAEFTGYLKGLAEASDYPSSDIGVYIQPRHQGVNCHCEFTLPYSPADAAGFQAFYLKAGRKLFDQGAFYTRPYADWADYAFTRDQQSTALLKKIKGLFDPKGIMNPGKLCFTLKGTEER